MNLFYKLIIGDWIEVAKNIENNYVGLCVTSPPYLDMRGVMEWSSYESYLENMKDCLKEIYRVLIPGRVFVMNISPEYIWNDKKYDIGFDLRYIAMKECNFKSEESIIWQKPSGMRGGASKRFGNFLKNSYPFYYKPNRIYEFIFILTKGKMRSPADKFCFSSEPGPKHPITLASKVVGDMNKYNSNIWKLGTSSQDNPWDYKHDDSLHTAMYPQMLSDLVIQFYSLKGDVVLDPFLGSGTTLESARMLERSCIGIEMREEMIPLIKTKTHWNQQGIDSKVEWIIERGGDKV